MYLLAPFILQNLKKFLGLIQSYENAIFGPKMAHLSWTKLFWFKPLLLLLSTYWPFHCAKFKKILTADPEYEDAPFFGPKWFSCPKQFFFGKLLISFSSAYQPLSLCKIFKKFLQRIQSMRMRHFSVQNGSVAPNNFFLENY